MKTPMSSSVKTVLVLAFGYITFFGAFIFSVSADAATRAPGAFVPTACGETLQAEDQPIVSKVCMGRIAGEAGAATMGAFEFRDEHDRAAVYRVTEVSNLLIKLLSGATRSQVFMVGPNGDEISMKINRMSDGSFRNAAGLIGDAKFVVPEFQPVVTTL